MNTEESREHISCLMDGEVNRETGRFLVRRLGADEELCATWARYHLVRDCMRHQDGGLASQHLAARIQRAIERESLPKSRRRDSRAWLRPAAGIAVAASVALMAIVAVGPGKNALPAGGDALAERAEAPAFTSPQSLIPAPQSEQVSLLGQSAGNSRMNAYLLRHYQATGSTGGKGFVSFVPIVVRQVAVRAESPEAPGSDAPGPDEEGFAQPK